MKKVFCSSLAVLCLLVIATPAESKGKPDKQQKHKVRTTEVAPTSGSTTVSSPQINTSGSSVTSGSQTVTTTTSGSSVTNGSQTVITSTENSTSAIGNTLNRNRSNSGGMMRGLERARQVQEMNKLRRNSSEQIIQSGINSTQTQTQVNIPTNKGKKHF